MGRINLEACVWNLSWWSGENYKDFSEGRQEARRHLSQAEFIIGYIKPKIASVSQHSVKAFRSLLW